MQSLDWLSISKFQPYLHYCSSSRISLLETVHNISRNTISAQDFQLKPKDYFLKILLAIQNSIDFQRRHNQSLRSQLSQLQLINKDLRVFLSKQMDKIQFISKKKAKKVKGNTCPVCNIQIQQNFQQHFKHHVEMAQQEKSNKVLDLLVLQQKQILQQKRSLKTDAIQFSDLSEKENRLNELIKRTERLVGQLQIAQQQGRQKNSELTDNLLKLKRQQFYNQISKPDLNSQKQSSQTSDRPLQSQSKFIFFNQKTSQPKSTEVIKIFRPSSQQEKYNQVEDSKLTYFQATSSGALVKVVHHHPKPAINNSKIITRSVYQQSIRYDLQENSIPNVSKQSIKSRISNLSGMPSKIESLKRSISEQDYDFSRLKVFNPINQDRSEILESKDESDLDFQISKDSYRKKQFSRPSLFIQDDSSLFKV